MRNQRRSKKYFRAIRKANKGRWLYCPREKYYNMLFEFNPYDDDDHPSVPHGDSLNHHYKLDLINGDVYKKREKIGHLHKREFERLKHDKMIRAIIRTAQSYYREHHPQIVFAAIPWCVEKAILSRRRIRKCPGVVYKLKVEIL